LEEFGKVHRMEAGAEPDVAIVPAGLERLEDLRPLWEALHRHHLDVAPELLSLGAGRSARDSWRVRHAHYLDLFRESSTFVLIAESGSVAIGYALVHVRGPEESWETGPVAELETLALLPEHRGRGIGSQLLQAVFQRLRQMGVQQWSVGVIGANREALRFYERFDLLPFMTSFIGHVPPGKA
jgi:ribosomal protein S18 acetylase RimI-like enzyme